MADQVYIQPADISPLIVIEPSAWREEFDVRRVAIDDIARILAKQRGFSWPMSGTACDGLPHDHAPMDCMPWVAGFGNVEAEIRQQAEDLLKQAFRNGK